MPEPPIVAEPLVGPGGELKLNEHIQVILREGRIQVRKIGREQVHVESHFACNPLTVTQIVPHFLSLPSCDHRKSSTPGSTSIICTASGMASPAGRRSP